MGYWTQHFTKISHNNTKSPLTQYISEALRLAEQCESDAKQGSLWGGLVNNLPTCQRQCENAIAEWKHIHKAILELEHHERLHFKDQEKVYNWLKQVSDACPTFEKKWNIIKKETTPNWKAFKTWAQNYTTNEIAEPLRQAKKAHDEFDALLEKAPESL